MSKEQAPKPEKINIERPDIEKGETSDWSGYSKLHYPDTGQSIKEGYQPITDIISKPPSGGSGVPDKGEDK